MSYQRVIPRDLFNESKLLKCLGRLSLLLLDYEGRWPIRLEHEDEESGFVIDQNPDDGGLYCVNLRLTSDDGRDIQLFTSYNSKEAYPLEFLDFDGGCEAVFGDDGEFTTEFLEFLKSLDATR